VSLLVIIIVGWIVLGTIALVFVLAIGKAAKRGDELLWREGLTRMLAARGRRRDQRRDRDRDRRSHDPRSQMPWSGMLDRRRQERRRQERRADPGWRDEADR
jgi:hypothetical protein